MMVAMVRARRRRVTADAGDDGDGDGGDDDDDGDKCRVCLHVSVRPSKDGNKKSIHSRLAWNRILVSFETFSRW